MFKYKYDIIVLGEYHRNHCEISFPDKQLKDDVISTIMKLSFHGTDQGSFIPEHAVKIIGEAAGDFVSED